MTWNDHKTMVCYDLQQNAPFHVLFWTMDQLVTKHSITCKQETVIRLSVIIKRSNKLVRKTKVLSLSWRFIWGSILCTGFLCLYSAWNLVKNWSTCVVALSFTIWVFRQLYWVDIRPCLYIENYTWMKNESRKISTNKHESKTVIQYTIQFG